MILLCFVAATAQADPPNPFLLSLQVKMPDGTIARSAGSGHVERSTTLKSRFIFHEPLVVKGENGLATVVRSIELVAKNGDHGVLDRIEQVQSDSVLLMKGSTMGADEFLMRSRRGSLVEYANSFHDLPSVVVLDLRVGFSITFEDLVARKPIRVDRNQRFDLRKVVDFHPNQNRFVLSEATTSMSYPDLLEKSRVTKIDAPLVLDLIERLKKVFEVYEQFTFKVLFSEGENGEDRFELLLPEDPLANVTSLRPTKTCESLFTSRP